ncbi:MAG: putative toxin-antitoxin system toxin component, PIN family [Bacteroidales bacterium]|nr:putative toxin-antitoxin system toxin component, PIN family [Bacteroidales bacterium]MCF8456077.1 putative toxin-antitoxin system toxin component, PIN family [Bacteroidales bacterium]
MQRIIVDTNVIVSSLIQRSYPNLIVFNIVVEGLARICLSDELMEEYLEVLNRPKFDKYPDFKNKAEFVLAQIESNAIFHPHRKN